MPEFLLFSCNFIDIYWLHSKTSEKSIKPVLDQSILHRLYWLWIFFEFFHISKNFIIISCFFIPTNSNHYKSNNYRYSSTYGIGWKQASYNLSLPSLNPPLSTYQENFQTDCLYLSAFANLDNFFHFPNLKQFVGYVPFSDSIIFIFSSFFEY